MVKFLVIFLTCFFVGLAAWWGLRVYSEIQSVQLSTNGMIAMGLGVFFTLAIGFGLMALLFFSNRHGHDERVHTLHKDNEPQD